MRSMKRFLAAALTLLMVAAMIQPFGFKVQAADKSSEIDKSGILQINVYHEDTNTGSKYFIQSGTGFLISDSSEGTQYVITCDHVAEVDEATQAYAREIWGVDKLNIKIDVVVTGDITETATIIKASQNEDFAILKLDAPIYQKKAMALRPEGPDLTEDVYAMGYPAVISELKDFNYYSEDEVTVSKGSVSLCELPSNGVPYVQHSATLTEGCSGGPLVDEDGYVVGVNTATVAMESGTYYYSLKISEVSNALDMLGINYQTSDGSSMSSSDTEEPASEDADDASDDASTEEVTTEAPVVIDTTALDSALTEATEYIKSDYTEESYADLEDAIDDAKAVKNNSAATQAEVDAATANLETAMDGLEEASNMTLWIIIGVVVLVVIVVVVIIIVVVKSGKKKLVSAKPIPTVYPPVSGAAPRPVGPTPIAPIAPVAPSTPKSMATGFTSVPPVSPVVSPASAAAESYMNEGAGETSVLGYGTGETTVLGASNQTKATLTRLKTNEKVDITKQLFRIGKERSKVDYCITNNNSVSRIHADIVCKGGQYYIIDNNSTNYTFVNGQMIPAKQEVALANGDKIKFAEEEFTFSIG